MFATWTSAPLYLFLNANKLRNFWSSVYLKCSLCLPIRYICISDTSSPQTIRSQSHEFVVWQTIFFYSRITLSVGDKMGPFKHTLSLCISRAWEEDSKVGKNTVLHILRERKERNDTEWSSKIFKRIEEKNIKLLYSHGLKIINWLKLANEGLSRKVHTMQTKFSSWTHNWPHG